MKVSLNIGINRYDRSYYGGNIDLAQCVRDAHAMMDFAEGRGFVPALMTDELATIENFKSKMGELAKALKKGDTLFLTLSQHGTYDDYIPMKAGEKVKRMTAMCFHNGILWDFEFRQLLIKFRAGVTVVKMSDSCFAESNWRFIRESQPYNEAKTRFARVPRTAVPTPTQGDKRSVRCIYFDYASSNVYQPSYEDEKGGVFTTAVLTALKKESPLSYYQIWRRASELIAGNYPQTPVFENVRGAKLTGNQFLGA